MASYAESVYAKSNIAVVCDGAELEEVAKWSEEFFDQDDGLVPASSTPEMDLKPTTSPTVYHGGERRSNHLRGSSMVIAFPGSPIGSIQPELLVLAALLGGQPSVKWSTGSAILSQAAASPTTASSATHLPYSDAGLLAIQINGPASGVAATAKESIKSLQSISRGSLLNDGFSRAIAKAKFDLLEEYDSRQGSILRTGAALLHGQSDTGIQSLVKAIEGVTVDQVRKVCITSSSFW